MGAKVRLERVESQQNTWGWNSDLQRAAPFYEARQSQEDAIEAQLKILQSMENRMTSAQTRLTNLRSTRNQGRVDISHRPRFQALDFHNFELAGGEPHDDEYLSCGSDGS